jgi:hypothetical protein
MQVRYQVPSLAEFAHDGLRGLGQSALEQKQIAAMRLKAQRDAQAGVFRPPAEGTLRAVYEEAWKQNRSSADEKDKGSPTKSGISPVLVVGGIAAIVAAAMFLKKRG